MSPMQAHHHHHHHHYPSISTSLRIYRNRGTKPGEIDMRAAHSVRRICNEKKRFTTSTTLDRELRNSVAAECSSSSTSSSSSSSSSSPAEDDGDENESVGKDKEDGQLSSVYLVREHGWKVRRMIRKDQNERMMVARVQAQAFRVPVLFFDDLFFQLFQAEVLAGLVYRLRSSPPDRYACLVAEANIDAPESRKELVGVVDVTVYRDEEVLQHLPAGVEEYLYASGMAVLNKFRRRKIATALLKACDVLCVLWGYEYLVLRAYEDDFGALKLYGNAGYRIVSGDPPWMTTWIGRKRRVLLMKRTK